MIFYKYIIFLLIFFFIYLLISQIVEFCYELRTNDKYFGYNAFGFGTTYDFGGMGTIKGDLSGLKGFSFLNFGIFSKLWNCVNLIEI